MKAYIIGGGGVGSLLCPTLCMLIGPEQVTVVDGDKLEPGNMNRQLFTKQDMGRNKADALAARYRCKSIPKFYSFGAVDHSKYDVLLVCVDNNPGRIAALRACDFQGCTGIFAANETLSSEAFIYKTEWRDTDLDPRITSPDLLTDATGDPTTCTGEAQENNRQLVSANMMAAAQALHLYVVHILEGPKLDRDTLPHLPSKLIQNFTKNETKPSIPTQPKPQTERTEP